MVQMGEGGFAGRRPTQLSGGQQQRVALARALVFEPELVLMDEPLGALDKQLREHMQYEIKHIHESLGVTVVYVTHDQTEALTMSDRVAVFNDGIVQQLAPPDVLYEKPDNSFVAQFIGENNTLHGTVTSVSGGECAVKLDIGEAGTRTQLSIRPERVEIDPEEAEIAQTVDGRVEEIIYLGDHIRTRMTVAGNSDFIVKTRNRLGARKFRVGEQVRVGWATEDCRALDPLPSA
jgi:putative spermidine/putrescine transport system ATP-binding protein